MEVCVHMCRVLHKIICSSPLFNANCLSVTKIRNQIYDKTYISTQQNNMKGNKGIRTACNKMHKSKSIVISKKNK